MARLPISREVVDGGFVYRLRGRKLSSRAEIARLNALAIPPAWQQVEIAKSPTARVLARGIDAVGRTQTIYHPSFRRRRDREKFDRMLRFGRALPRLRAAVDRDLRKRRLSRERVTACVIRLIDLQYFRVGSSRYAKRYRSYGVTTLRARHVEVNRTSVEFDFVGKSGKRHRQRVQDARLARLISQLLEVPGHEVFRFFDDDDDDELAHRVRSRHVNAYVKQHMGAEFTAKDFRTWGGTVLVASALLELDTGELETEIARKKAVRDAVSLAAGRLGNTPAVTRESYVDPRALRAAERPELLQRVKRMRPRPARYLTREEQLTLRLLEEQGRSKR